MEIGLYGLSLHSIRAVCRKLAWSMFYGSLELPELHKIQAGCLGGAVVGRWTRDRKVAGSKPGLAAIQSTSSTQPSIPSLRRR